MNISGQSMNNKRFNSTRISEILFGIRHHLFVNQEGCHSIMPATPSVESCVILSRKPMWLSIHFGDPRYEDFSTLILGEIIMA